MIGRVPLGNNIDSETILRLLLRNESGSIKPVLTGLPQREQSRQ